LFFIPLPAIQNRMNEYTKLPIKHWAEDDRPREKLLLKGKGILTKAELIAILIGSGNSDESAVTLSQIILKSVKNNLAELSKLSVNGFEEDTEKPSFIRLFKPVRVGVNKSVET